VETPAFNARFYSPSPIVLPDTQCRVAVSLAGRISAEEESETMVTKDTLTQTQGREAELYLQRQWPQLGRELFTLEHAPTSTNGTSLTEQEERERQAKIKEKIIARVFRNEDEYSFDIHYCALLFVKHGRAAEIVGNPFYLGEDGCRQELPYTGLEGYYAGSVRTSKHPGLAQEAIVQELADRGVQLLRDLKKHSIATYSWAGFSKMNKALKGEKPVDVEDLRTVCALWAQVVRRLHVRIYHNEEFESTLTEQIEQVQKLLSAAAREGEEHKRILEVEYARLKRVLNTMSEEEKAHERCERRKRESMRRARLSEYHAFRKETYTLLKEAGNHEYDISVRDMTLREANIIETVTLPKTCKRDTYTPVLVKLTPEQLAGYPFLAELGEIGGDPLARSLLNSAWINAGMPGWPC
jgi:hypothetical protein